MLEMSIVTILPTVLLGVFIYLKDKKEKEPLKLLFLMVFCGIVAFAISHFIKVGVNSLILCLFKNKLTIGMNGDIVSENNAILALYNFLCVFIGITFVEETTKFLLLFCVTNNNKYYDYMFDGIVYSCFLAIGFSGAQMLYYGFADGWDTILLRALATLPLNVMYAVITGILYSIWHSNNIAVNIEQKMQKRGQVKKIKIKKKHYLNIMAMLIPMMIHTALSLFDMSGTVVFSVIMYFMIFLIYVFCFFMIRKFSENDQKKINVAKNIVSRNHPDLVDVGDEYDI